jgi:hypothetical protein
MSISQRVPAVPLAWSVVESGQAHPQRAAPARCWPSGLADQLKLSLARLEPVLTSAGPGLLKAQVVQVIRALLGQRTNGLTPATVEAFLETGIIDQALVGLGYEPVTAWVPLPGRADQPSDGQEVFLRSVRIPTDTVHVSLADGFSVRAPALVRDQETLIYLELLGPRQAVQANWAALRSGRRQQVPGGYLRVQKSDGVVTLKQTLPIGWDHWAVIHAQASVQAVRPGVLFYLLDDGTQPQPPAFFPMLAKTLALPVLPQWADYLWVHGRLAGTITLLAEGCVGRLAWRVSADPHPWQTIVAAGLQGGDLILAPPSTVIESSGASWHTLVAAD